MKVALQSEFPTHLGVQTNKVQLLEFIILISPLQLNLGGNGSIDRTHVDAGV